MKKILIADSDKISVLSTTEIFKDYYPGIKISIASTSKEFLQIAQTNSDFDAFVIDFDLPDLNGVNTAIKLEKFSKRPIFITGFDTPDVSDALTKALPKLQNIYQRFLKKPLQGDVVRAVCDQKFNFSAKSKTLPTNLIGLVRYKKNQSAMPVLIKECGLGGMMFELLSTNQLLQGSSSPICINNEISNNAKIILNCPSLNAIELGETIDLHQISEMTKKLLFETFSLELKGQIVEMNQEKTNFWISCEDTTATKKLFEAISFQKMNQQLKYQLTLLHA